MRGWQSNPVGEQTVRPGGKGQRHTEREEEALKERGGKKEIQERDGDLDWEVKIFRAWQGINSWHYQQRHHRGLAINS